MRVDSGQVHAFARLTLSYTHSSSSELGAPSLDGLTLFALLSPLTSSVSVRLISPLTLLCLPLRMDGRPQRKRNKLPVAMAHSHDYLSLFAYLARAVWDVSSNHAHIFAHIFALPLSPSSTCTNMYLQLGTRMGGENSLTANIHNCHTTQRKKEALRLLGQNRLPFGGDYRTQSSTYTTAHASFFLFWVTHLGT